MVQRAGDVIPEIVEVLKERPTGREACLRCRSVAPFAGPRVRLEDGVVPRCVDLSCPAKLKESIVHFASKRAMDIEGLGDKTVDQLVERGLVKDIGDLYGLSKDAVLKLDRLADKFVRSNLIAAIERSKQTTFPRFLYALGIRHVGEHVADVLARQYSDWQALQRAGYEELQSIHEIGPRIAQSIVAFFQDTGNQGVLEKLHRSGVRATPLQRLAVDHALRGKTLVLTR